MKHKDAGNLLCAFEDTNKYTLGASNRCISARSNNPVEDYAVFEPTSSRAWTRRAVGSIRC